MADIFSFEKGEMEGKDMKQCHPSPESYEKFCQKAYAILATGQSYYAEELRKRKDATLFWCTLIGNALDHQNIPKGAIWIYRDIAARKQAEAEREKLITELKQALSEIKKLSGYLPICASCKKIRNDEGYWQQIETYIKEHSEAEFTHGICPDCKKIYYPDYCKD
jgi:PAS domain S-box-containing protein